MNLFLTVTPDNNAKAYRLNGVLIERLRAKTAHPQEHMIEVVKRIRYFTGTDIGYSAARRIWDTRSEITFNPFTQKYYEYNNAVHQVPGH